MKKVTSPLSAMNVNNCILMTPLKNDLLDYSDENLLRELNQNLALENTAVFKSGDFSDS